MVSNQEATRGVPMYDQRQSVQDPTFAPNGCQGQGQGQMQGQQYGIQEPAPANEMLGGSAW